MKALLPGTVMVLGLWFRGLGFRGVPGSRVTMKTCFGTWGCQIGLLQ